MGATNDASSSTSRGHRDGAPTLDIRSEMTRRRSAVGAAIDVTGRALARPSLLLAIFVLHAGWIVLNLGVVPGLAPWDPAPFPLLSMIASVEAPLLALLVLMRQLRDERIAELREELLVQMILAVDQKVSQSIGRAAVDPQRLLEALWRRLDEAEGKIEGERDDG